MTSAMASRVMSSWVGPRPPQTMTPSLRARAVRRARTMRAWLSPTAWWKWESTPAAASCSPSQAELVSAIWPSSSSVPTATISILTRRSPAGLGRPSTRYWAPVAKVSPAATQTAASCSPCWWASGGTRQVAMARSCTSVLTLAEVRAGIETPRRPAQER